MMPLLTWNDIKGSDQILDAPPMLKDLYNKVTPEYAAHWRIIGTLLDISKGRLDGIERSFPSNAFWCCNTMLETWLEIDVSATWRKLIEVLDSPAVRVIATTTTSAVTTSHTPAVPSENIEITRGDSVAFLSDRVKNISVQIKQKVDKNNWPPKQTKDFVPLVLLQHQTQRTMQLAIKRAEYYQSDNIHEIISLINSGQSSSVSSKCHRLENHGLLENAVSTSKVTQDIAEILASLEKTDTYKFIVIEGAPGIGKSFLLKEIAYQWGKGQLLQRFKFVLLVCLRDPFIQQLSSIEELLLTFCKRDFDAKRIALACSNHLFHNDGIDLTFLLDGYDEYPQHLQQNSLIADILNREVLPNCGIVVSSRPHASVYLQEQAEVRVDILGFTEADRKLFIQQALKGQPQKIQELTQYLVTHLSINSLCLIPFNIAVLVFLYNHGNILPKNSTELYEHFIYLTIYGNLVRSGHSLPKHMSSLSNLPTPCNKILKQLSKFSLDSVNEHKLIFTQDEIESACPDIMTNPEAVNGFGLLQAIEHFGVVGTTLTFNFTHLSIQEFLAAHYIAHLPPADERKVLEEKFWSSNHVNVFTFYVALTKGQHSSFKEFLSDGDGTIAIAEKFLADQLKCFCLFQYFYEAGDMNMCRCIEEAKTFDYRKNKRIELTDSRFLSLSNLECVAFFLTHSVYKSWDEGINFYRCYIQDPGIRLLHHRLVGAGITISKLWLDCNGLTSSSLALISDIVVSCKVKVLWIDGNEIIGEDENFYGMLNDPSSELELLHMSDAKISSVAGIKLFTALATRNNLKVLWITLNDISDEACSSIAATLKDNTSLTKLNLGDNPISAESIQLIVKALQHNTTLEELVLPAYSEDERNTIVPLVEAVNQIRVICKCQVKLNVTFW